jgi:hypothetical protein
MPWANGKVLDSQGCDAVRWRLMPIDMNILPLIQPRLRKNWASKCTLGILSLAADTTIAAPPTERLRRLDFRLDLF